MPQYFLSERVVLDVQNEYPSIPHEMNPLQARREVDAMLISFNPFVTSPGDLRGVWEPFIYEPRRSPGLIAWDNYDVIK